MPSVKTSRHALRPDAQAFDEIRITTVPRYKTSGLSGDEWRISARVEFLRKGEVRHTAEFLNVEYACGFLYGEYHRAIDNGRAYFAGDGVHCDQEGCSEPWTVRLRRLKAYCRDGEAHAEFSPDLAYRHFCDVHSKRGDCGLDDADSNYEREAPRG